MLCPPRPRRVPCSILCAALALWLIAAPAVPGAEAAACSGTYTVQDGDTCNSIGYRTYTSTYQLMALNINSTGPDCQQLEAGMVLCLGEFGTDCQVVHQVSDGETCSSIASDFGTTAALIEANNPTMRGCTNLYPGLMLCVSAAEIHPPPPSQLGI